LKQWTTADPRNTPSSTKLEEEEIVGALGNDGNASMPERVKRPNPWRKMMMMLSVRILRVTHGMSDVAVRVLNVKNTEHLT